MLLEYKASIKGGGRGGSGSGGGGGGRILRTEPPLLMSSLNWNFSRVFEFFCSGMIA